MRASSIPPSNPRIQAELTEVGEAEASPWMGTYRTNGC
jgi:hypothetical protein